MGGLRVLITNWTMSGRHGSVTYVRDLALGLHRHGHRPVVYSTTLGEVADELRLATVPVVDRLDLLGGPPDVIHGNHHRELMTALLRYPEVPAVHVCHAWGAWEAAPPRFPRLRRYVAVDDTCRDWLVCEQGIVEEKTQVLLNAVDLQRFAPRGPLPGRPRRALVFSNYAGAHTFLEAVRVACAGSGLALDVVGTGVGNPCARPEDILGQYDLVFAKARCALEALAVGTAVVLCDGAGAGPLVTTDNWEGLRRLNFGRRALREPARPDVLAREIARYDPADAAAVSRRTRAGAELDAAVEDYVGLYRRVLDEQAAADPADEGRAASAYLHWLTHYLHYFECRVRLGEEERDRLLAAVARLRAEADQLRSERDGLGAEGARVREEIRQVRAEAGRAQAEADQRLAALTALHNSLTVRLSNRLRRVPLAGGWLRSLARKLAG
jgi:hypothetical protein